MSFSRHREIYRYDVGPRGGRAAAPSHHSDESPAGYSSAGCSPAEPASASPAASSMRGPNQRDNEIAANGEMSPICLSQAWGPVQCRITQFFGLPATVKFGTVPCSPLFPLFPPVDRHRSLRLLL